MIHLPYLVIPRIIVDIIPTQVIFFDCFGYAVIHFPLVETSAFDDVDMVFWILDFAINNTGRDFMAMYKWASGIFAHTIDFLHLLRTNPFLYIVCSFIFGEESVNWQLLVIIEPTMTDFRNVVFTASLANGFPVHMISCRNLLGWVITFRDYKGFFWQVAFLFPFLGCICSITMLYIDFVKLGT